MKFGRRSFDWLNSEEPVSPGEVALAIVFALALVLGFRWWHKTPPAPVEHEVVVPHR